MKAADYALNRKSSRRLNAPQRARLRELRAEDKVRCDALYDAAREYIGDAFPVELLRLPGDHGIEFRAQLWSGHGLVVHRVSIHHVPRKDAIEYALVELLSAIRLPCPCLLCAKAVP